MNDLSAQVEEQRILNEAAKLRNKQLEGDVRSLEEGLEAIEERARDAFGMIKDDEIFIQLVDPESSSEKPR